MIDEQFTFMGPTGQRIEFGNSAPFILLSHDGVGGAPATIQMQKSPYQDGQTYIDTLLEIRPIALQILIKADNQSELSTLRAKLINALNPKGGPRSLRYKVGEHEKEIFAAVEHAPVFASGGDNRGATFQVALINFICPDPCWRDINPTNIKLEDFVANFSFPFSFPVRFAIRGDTRTLVNAGHVPTPVKITFRGESINPKITKIDTGEFVKINRTIPAGYSLVITTGFNDKSVRIIAPDGVETNAMGYIDLNSTFFALDVGDNQLSFITDGGQPDVYIEYRNLYLGV